MTSHKPHIVKPIAYDLFGGAGGATCGLLEAGYDVHAFERWDVAADTHDKNHDRPTHRIDLMERIPAGPPPALMWGSPPCQPFSAAGDQLGGFDDRDCIPGFMRAVEHHRPPVVIMENVKGLSFEKHWLYVDTVLFDQLRMLGYRAEWKVLDCADYGVPQNRERFILIARRDGGRIVWPMPTHTAGDSLFLQRWVTMADALGWGHTEVPSPVVITARNRQTGADVLRGSSWRHDWWQDEMAASRVLLDTHRDQRDDGSTQTRDPHSAPAPALTAKAGGQWTLERPATSIACDPRVAPPGHKGDGEDAPRQMDGAIRLTVEQAARLQDFPDGYRFTGTKTAQFTQIGNAVPRTLARVLAEANRPLLDRDELRPVERFRVRVADEATGGVVTATTPDLPQPTQQLKASKR